jgi:VWFA-related protein
MPRFGWFVALLWCVTATSTGRGFPHSQAESGQSPAAAPLTLIPRSHEERERRYRAIHHLILNVLAVDEFNTPVSGLKPQDFVLMDNGQPQELSSFREVSAGQGIASPHVILILDAVNNTRRSIALEAKEIGKYLVSDQGRLQFPTSIATLTASGFKASQPSVDRSVLSDESRSLFKNVHPYECKSSSDDAAQALPLSGHGDMNIGLSIETINDGNCLNDRFKLSLTALTDLATAQRDVLGRVVVIWVGPGWPLLTGPAFHPDSAEIKANFFDRIVELSRTLREAQVTVDAAYSPDMFRKSELKSGQVRPFAEGPLTEEQATAGDLSLQAIATQSGGRILESKSIAAQIARCVADMQTYYALSFDSVPSSRPDEYHSLQVKVKKPGVKALTNTLYYGEL